MQGTSEEWQGIKRKNADTVGQSTNVAVPGTWGDMHVARQTMFKVYADGNRQENRKTCIDTRVNKKKAINENQEDRYTDNKQS